MSETVQIRSWYLTNTEDNHNKFYAVHLFRNGMVITHWGRIGQTGTTKRELLPTYEAGEHIALRQVYSKAARGYQIIRSDWHWTHVEVSDWRFTLTFMRQQINSQDKTAALRLYAEFTERSQRLMDLLMAGEDALEHFDDLADLRAEWESINDAHDMAQTVIQLTEAQFTKQVLT